MRNETRKLYDAYTQRIAQLNGVGEATKTFTAEPSVQQTLETAMQESSEFLGRINVYGVNELEGEKIGLGVGSTVAGRTDTSGGTPRQPRSVATLSSQKYKCEKTDFDTFVGYSQLDAWAKFSDFQTRIANAILQRQALDRITIGFNGTSAAATTDRTANPLLEDVNIGWLQHYRVNAAARVMSAGATAGKVTIGAEGDYKNLDALVFDAVTLLDPWYRRNPGLVVLTGRELIHDKYFPLVNREQAATDTLATDVILSQRRIGGLPTYDVPYIPEGTLMITAFENLSLYWQLGARRRHIVEEPNLNRVTNYESSNDAYVVEDYGFGAVVENIEVAA